MASRLIVCMVIWPMWLAGPVVGCHWTRMSEESRSVIVSCLSKTAFKGTSKTIFIDTFTARKRNMLLMVAG